MKNTINVRKTRDVFDVLGDTFNYIRVYYKSLSKMIAVYVLIPLMAGSIILSLGVGSLFSQGVDPVSIAQSGPFLGLGLEFISGTIFLIISYLLLSGVIYQHIYYAGQDHVPEDISEFSSGMFSKLLRFVPFMLLLGFLLSGVMILTVVLLVEISLWLILLVIPASIYLFVKVILFPIAFFVEDAGGFNSLLSSWQLTKNYFWQTLGVYLLISIVFGILSQLLSTPLFLVSFIVGAGVGAESGVIEILVVVSYILSFVFQMLFLAAQSISLGLHYYNLEERKEAYSLGEQIAGLERDTA